MRPEQIRLIDIQGIALLLKVAPGTVDQWRQRGVLPKPTFPHLKNPVWLVDIIIQWAKDTGRWPYGDDDPPPLPPGGLSYDEASRLGETGDTARRRRTRKASSFRPASERREEQQRPGIPPAIFKPPSSDSPEARLVAIAA